MGLWGWKIINIPNPYPYPMGIPIPTAALAAAAAQLQQLEAEMHAWKYRTTSNLVMYTESKISVGTKPILMRSIARTACIVCIRLLNDRIFL